MASRWVMITFPIVNAGADGTGGNDQHFLSGLALLGDLCHQLLHLNKIGLFVVVSQHTRAELHHNAGGVFKQLRTHSVW